MQLELPKRKNIRLKHYDYSTDGAYFITVCTHWRALLFGEISPNNANNGVGDGFPVPKLTNEGKTVEEYINSLTTKYPAINVDKYVIMPDHIHMIISIYERENQTLTQSVDKVEKFIGGTGNPSPTIGTIMGWFKYQTTKRINEISNTAGKRIWQRSFHDRIIRNEQEYLGIWEYIDKNPLTWVLGEHEEWHP